MSHKIRSHDDLLILSESAKLRHSSTRHRGPVVIDLIDGYLSSNPPPIQDFARNMVRATIGKSSFSSITFSNELIKSILNASAVVVSCEEQAIAVSRFNKNVHCILDDHSELRSFGTELDEIKSGTFTLIWEGLGYTLKHLLEIADDLEKFLLSKQAKLIVVTNSSFRKYASRFGQVDVKSILQRKFRNTWNSIEFVEWSVPNLKNSSRCADVAIIPLSSRDDFAMSKPENKLLSFWTLGVPVICSPTPAYKRVLSSIGHESFLASGSEWYDKLSEYHDSITNRNDELMTARIASARYLKQFHTREILSRRWDEVLRPLL